MKKTFFHHAVQGISTAAGAGIGGMFGQGMVGAGIGYGTSGMTEDLLRGLNPKILNSKFIKATTPGLIKKTAGKAAGKVAGMVGGALSQKALK
jgi:hypothetical protein